MNKLKNYLLCVFGISVMMNAFADANTSNNALMTALDVQNNSLSNITINNGTSQAISVAGLFIASFDVNDCSACNGNVTGGDNAGGMVVAPVTIQTHQGAAIGQNYLYNMIYNGIYYIRNTVGSSPCQLPGCSWPGDSTSVSGWCISINAASLNSNYTSSTYTNGSNPAAAAPAYAAAGTSPPFHYNYDLINPLTLGAGAACLGPITCNDQTLTCRVTTPQSESLQSY